MTNRAPARSKRPNLQQMSLLSAAILVLLWILENLVGEHFGPTALLTYLPQHGFAVLPAIVLVLALVNRNGKLVALNFLAFLFWGKALLGFNVPLPRRADERPTVRVMSFNVARGIGGADNIVDLIRAQNPDIVCLQESQNFTRREKTFFPGNRIVQQFLGWKWTRAGDVLTMSRFPLVSKQVWDQRGTRRFLETTWRTPNGDLRVINAHISTSFQGQDSNATNQKERVVGVALNARATASARLDQVPYLTVAIRGDGVPRPTILIGDFNTPRRGVFYRFLASQLRDGWSHSGTGTGASYPSKWPILPIDQLFLSETVRAQTMFFPRSRASDHLPLVADLSF